MEIRPTKKGYRPAELRTAFFDSRFGNTLIAIEPETKRIVWLSLVLDKSAKAKKDNLEELEIHWQPETLNENGVDKFFEKPPGDWIFEDGCAGLKLFMKGTEFQHEVWNALRKIPKGETRSYSEVAEQLNRPKNHARAVASAVASNTIAVLVPCHRVIQSSGKISGFRWGPARKRMLLDWEAAATQNAV